MASEAVWTSSESSTVGAMLQEPAVADAPRRVRRDYVLAGLLLCTAAAEGVLRSDLSRPAITVPLVMALVMTLLWRRTHSLAMVLVTAGTFMATDLALVTNDEAPLEIYTMAFILILFYALARWASGRHVAIGALAAIVLAVGSQAMAYTGVGDIIGGSIVIMLPILLGAAIRFQSSARHQLVERAKIQEREELARELHDTVAHRVSAIAIQAQAGQIQLRAGANPEKVAKTLATIEEESSRTLTEMRLMVGTLREHDLDDPAMHPQQGLQDIAGFGDASIRPGLDIEVDMPGDLGHVDSTTGAALFRIAQESVTNAARHAIDATRVDIKIAVEGPAVRLTVDDNGRPSQRSGAMPGFGLMGMSERAERLGGTFSAGPSSASGWRVEVLLPSKPSGSKGSTARNQSPRSVTTS